MEPVKYETLWVPNSSTKDDFLYEVFKFDTFEQAWEHDKHLTIYLWEFGQGCI